MPKLANANNRARVVRALRRAGFVDVPGGKHLIMRHDDGRWTAIPGSRERLRLASLDAVHVGRLAMPA